ncbi:hypothetical protein V6N11_033311 [Hibiscus sabdariffa]|uniref:Uncharacterized protein n=1 Tax=Hibiscus sabdariffa TaxID=183260 RepID=A0ABR2PXP5_9ROSI
MAKFPLVVFSLALILSIQFVIGIEDDDRIQDELSDKEEEVVFYQVFENIIEILINDKLVNRSVMETKVTMVEFYEAYEKAKEKRHPSAVEVSMEDEKQIFYVTLEYAIEMMASSGLIDHDVVYNELFPGKTKTLAPKFDKMVGQAIEKARTDDKDYEDDNLKPRIKGKYKTQSKGKYKSRSKGKENDDSSKTRSKRKGKGKKDDDDTSKARSKGEGEGEGKRKRKEKEDDDDDDTSKARSKGEGKGKGKEDNDDNSKARSKGKEDDDNSKARSKGKEDDDASKTRNKGKDNDQSDGENNNDILKDKKENDGNSEDKNSL